MDRWVCQQRSPPALKPSPKDLHRVELATSLRNEQRNQICFVHRISNHHCLVWSVVIQNENGSCVFGDRTLDGLDPLTNGLFGCCFRQNVPALLPQGWDSPVHRNTRPSGADATLFLEVNIEPVMSVLPAMSNAVKTKSWEGWMNGKEKEKARKKRIKKEIGGGWSLGAAANASSERWFLKNHPRRQKLYNSPICPDKSKFITKMKTTALKSPLNSFSVVHSTLRLRRIRLLLR